MESAFIRITRRSTKDIKIRGLRILIDDEDVADLSYGRAIEVEVPPGKHTVRVTNNMFSATEEADLAPGETKAFDAANIPKGYAPMFLVIIGITPYGVELKPGILDANDRLVKKIKLPETVSKT